MLEISAVFSNKEFLRSVLWFGIGVSVLILTSCSMGLIMFAHYADCDPYKTMVRMLLKHELSTETYTYLSF